MSGNSLDDLLRRYARLSDRPPGGLTDDDQRSLVYFRAEMHYRAGKAIDEIDAPRRVRNWIVDVTRLDEFDALHGRAPHKTSAGRHEERFKQELHLAEWVDYRRDTWDELCTYQQERLLCIRSFELDPRENRWDAQVDRYKRLVDRTSRSPLVTSSDPEERIAAGWAAKVRAKMRRGALGKHQIDQVSELKYWWWER